MIRTLTNESGNYYFRAESGNATGSWSYLWNKNSTIGDQSGYVELQYNSDFYNIGEMGWVVDSSTGVPAAGEGYYTRIWEDITSNGAHPGRGVSNGAATDRFAIATYTVGEAGSYSILNSKAADATAPGGNQELRVYVNNTLINSYTVLSGNTIVFFDGSLGNLNIGDKIYVALGPDGDDTDDGVLWDFSITLNGTVIADFWDDFYIDWFCNYFQPNCHR